MVAHASMEELTGEGGTESAAIDPTTGQLVLPPAFVNDDVNDDDSGLHPEVQKHLASKAKSKSPKGKSKFGGEDWDDEDLGVFGASYGGAGNSSKGYTGTGGYTGYSGGSYYKACKEGHNGKPDQYLLKSKDTGTTIAGATGYNAHWWKAAVVVDLAKACSFNNSPYGFLKPESKLIIPTGEGEDAALLHSVIQALKGPALTKPDVIHLDWPDQKCPPANITKAWWKALWFYLSHTYPGQHVITCCVGGHGRTGTALASLCIAVAGMDAGEAIEYVREKHCDECIESQAQVDYLFTLAGEQLPKAGKYLSYSTTSYQGTGKGGTTHPPVASASKGSASAPSGSGSGPSANGTAGSSKGYTVGEIKTYPPAGSDGVL